MRERGILFFIFLCIFLFSPALHAEDVYQPPKEFIAQAFGGAPPAPEILWLTGDAQNAVKQIMGDHYNLLRTRYWQKGARTVWILEDIGKFKPITAGFVVENGRMKTLKVLIYREGRHGHEVKYPYFTEQFDNAVLENDYGLDKRIDGISGATLSVNALTDLASLALYLHQQATK